MDRLSFFASSFGTMVFAIWEHFDLFFFSDLILVCGVVFLEPVQFFLVWVWVFGIAVLL